MDIGHYKIKKQIGEGAFGRTFLGEHNILDIQVCIKQEKTGQDPYTKLFREEAAILAKLRHPSLPAFIDYIEEDLPIGQILILSYIQGTPLDTFVQTTYNSDGEPIVKKPIDDEHILWIIDRLLSALSYLHGKWQIIHCDLKPGNIIIDIDDHNASIIDLGMAAWKPDEWSKSKGGTPGYLPPEFSNSFPPIPASDIYSLGKIICSISGGDPLRGTFPDDMNSELKTFFETWIKQDPKQRPQSCDKLRHDIAKLRHKVYGRSTCKEKFKFRKKRRRK
jgi:serine/threonine protein kinase